MTVPPLGSPGFLRAFLRSRSRELLIAAVTTAGDAAADGLAKTYYSADTNEAVVILGSLFLLPRPERFADIGKDACRSSVCTVFEAIALDNPYPARHFDEQSFNQMVLKALSMDCDLGRLVRLEERITPSLRRAAQDFKAERQAADRVVPHGVDVILTAG